MLHRSILDTTVKPRQISGDEIQHQLYGNMLLIFNKAQTGVGQVIEVHRM